MLRPYSCPQIQQECLACRERVAIFDMSYFGKYFLMGPDAQKAADWIFSANMARQPGATIYTCMLNAKGGVEADLTVVSIGIHFLPLTCFVSRVHILVTHYFLFSFFPHHSLLLVLFFSLNVLPFL